jgi:predicted amidohydrolase YtcJ
MKWDLWVDYHRTDGDGLTHTNIREAEEGVVIEPGRHIVVGDYDADLAVAEVVSIADNGVVLVRVLPGPVEDHLHLVRSGRTR